MMTTDRNGRDSWATSAGTRASMQSNRGRDTGPELAVRRRLHALGLRYRVSVKPEKDLRRTADIVFTRPRVAVFIDGCFWHGCPKHATKPKNNQEFWRRKLSANKTRDSLVTRTLRRSGWRVWRVWEHTLRWATKDPKNEARLIRRLPAFISG